MALSEKERQQLKESWKLRANQRFMKKSLRQQLLSMATQKLGSELKDRKDQVLADCNESLCQVQSDTIRLRERLESAISIHRRACLKYEASIQLSFMRHKFLVAGVQLRFKKWQRAFKAMRLIPGILLECKQACEKAEHLEQVLVANQFFDKSCLSPKIVVETPESMTKLRQQKDVLDLLDCEVPDFALPEDMPVGYRHMNQQQRLQYANFKQDSARTVAERVLQYTKCMVDLKLVELGEQCVSAIGKQHALLLKQAKEIYRDIRIQDEVYQVWVKHFDLLEGQIKHEANKVDQMGRLNNALRGCLNE